MFHPPQNESSPHITDNFDPSPQNVDVPQELLPYIPHPLYSRSGTTYYAPDSSQWFHRMSSFAKRHQTIKKPDARERLEEECRTFTEKYLNTVEAYQRWKSTSRSDMSDDTKRLEQRLNKRNT
ncbi:unnamed protein product [Rhizophagus irregularis]|uniref:Uncharacterized protein n=1 Tax=Rhizophagus irregularis TaxID=588596 RepID=A0A915ZE27_9GLOM|nr:unnamed protein product [Rhizophagus irregularis]CAB5371591.1 unnamed protein product [Rhizophagus irregularis]